MSQIQKSSSSSASSAASIPPEHIIALPSLSCQLSSLPAAKSIDSVSLHPTSMSAQRAAESEAKLRKLLSKNGAPQSGASSTTYASHPHARDPASGSPPLMMRKPVSRAARSLVVHLPDALRRQVKKVHA
ncbi:uncharacterized protein LAESUDRAFT_391925 [Laetiporus sulphureus 93-53]|uniref:Uncharacterized protein n=1 Tax=Laetiporus sulphureus 93-53 TaxID=1314785 RepID=A0A165CHP2_9APHY|nr:uncharacterized protein LAESUDRAFT_391925 [Laetiporus sulphureus 93-53]KZT02834.1 hypothetical protein LAESUDRAFT_391925 [Laetiporus sulphureus 93-53]